MAEEDKPNMNKMLLAVLMTLLVGTVVFADCAAPVPAGTSVEVAPMVTVVSVECPMGMFDGRSIIEHKMTQYYENNRMLTLWVRPFPPQGMSEISAVLTNGYGNLDKNASVDVKVVGAEGDKWLRLKRVAPGVYCGHADFAAGWTEVRAWITTPEASYFKTFNFWAGTMAEKPRMVNWTCPKCQVTTVSTSCPICVPQP